MVTILSGLAGAMPKAGSPMLQRMSCWMEAELLPIPEGPMKRRLPSTHRKRLPRRVLTLSGGTSPYSRSGFLSGIANLFGLGEPFQVVAGSLRGSGTVDWDGS
jgi:hypothetical protein